MQLYLTGKCYVVQEKRWF